MKYVAWFLAGVFAVLFVGIIFILSLVWHLKISKAVNTAEGGMELMSSVLREILEAD